MSLDDMTKPETFRWITKDMQATVDLSDKDAVYENEILDRQLTRRRHRRRLETTRRK